MIHTLIFHNKDSAEKVVHIVTDTDSLQHILRWYGAYHSGDRYKARLDGVNLKLDQNGELSK